MKDQLSSLVANGAIIMAKTDNAAEKDLVASTTANLTDQLAQLTALVEEKKNRANDALDAWQKFLTMAAGSQYSRCFFCMRYTKLMLFSYAYYLHDHVTLSLCSK